MMRREDVGMAQKNAADVSDRTEQTAEFVRDAVSGWNVAARRRKGATARDIITVYADKDISVNSYSKASVINTVLSEVPALEVDSTEDGDMAVTFTFQNQ